MTLIYLIKVIRLAAFHIPTEIAIEAFKSFQTEDEMLTPGCRRWSITENTRGARLH